MKKGEPFVQDKVTMDYWRRIYDPKRRDVKRSIMAKGVLIAMGMAGVAYADNDSSHYSSLSSWTGFYAGMDAGFV